MKNLFVIFLFLFICNLVNAQGHTPSTQYLGTPQTTTEIRGLVKANKGIVNKIYTDTTQANLDSNYISTYAGAQIITADGSIWVRSSDVKSWDLKQRQIITTIAGLRSLKNPVVNTVYYTDDYGKQGFWFYDPIDITSVDNGATILVSGTKRFIRIIQDGKLHAGWFGFKTGGGATDSTLNANAIQSAIDYAISLNNPALIESKSIEILLPEGDAYCNTINFKKSTVLRGAGKIATRIYYCGDDYWLSGITGGIHQGGVFDMSILTYGGSRNKGLIHLVNSYNMLINHVFIGGAIYGSEVTEAAVKIESDVNMVGFNNNTYNVTLDNFTIYGSGGYGFLLTGNYGSASIVVSNGTIENTDNNNLCITTTASVAHTSPIIKNVILQGGNSSPLSLGWVRNADVQVNTEMNNNLPAIIMGTTGKPILGLTIHNSSFGTGNSFGGAVFKSGAMAGDGTIFANQAIEIDNINVQSGVTTDTLVNMASSSVSLKSLVLTNITYLFKAYDDSLGNLIVDLTSRLQQDVSTIYRVGNTNQIIKNGYISYFRGYTFIGTNVTDTSLANQYINSSGNNLISGQRIGSLNNTSLRLMSNGTQRAIFDSIGRIGFGMEAIHTGIDFNGITYFQNGSVRLLSNTSYTIAGYNLAISDYCSINYVAAAHNFNISGVAKFSINSDGRVLINGGTNDGINALQVSGTVKASTPAYGSKNLQLATTEFVDSTVRKAIHDSLSSLSVVYKRAIVYTANATDADFTADVNSFKKLPNGVLTGNKNITIPTGNDDDEIELYNRETVFTWNLIGSPVYYWDETTILTALAANTFYTFKKIDGKWTIKN